ncbi:SDR family oxidoreductase [Micromonosporaceae bacterium B7E4]
MVRPDRAAVAAGKPDLFSVAGKRVLVTGGSRGIGRMIAAGFVEAGSRVIISARPSEELERAAAAMRADGECVAVPADLATMEGVRTLAAAVAETAPRLDVLVNNAGTTWGAPPREFPVERWDAALATNLRSVFYLTVALLDRLRAAGTADDPASVINIGSVDGLRVPDWDNFAYSASKAALHQLTRQLARRVAAEQVTVNAIAPGLFESKMTRFLLDDQAGRDRVTADVPLGRIGRPEDVIGVTRFLASRAGAYLTGTVIRVDGGLAI